jgi:hypothetical protein
MARESNIERRAVKFLEEAGYLTMKAGKTGWPDRLVLLRTPRHCHEHNPSFHLWIEFKQPGAPLTKAQQRRIPKLKERGEVVLIIDRPDTAIALVNRWHATAIEVVGEGMP